MLYYAKSTGGFYDTAIHGDIIPVDAVEISADEHRALLDAQSAGKVIAASEDGKPVAVDAPAPTLEQRAASLREQRAKLLARTGWLVERHRDQVDAGALTTLSAEQYKGILAFRQALRDLPAQKGFPDVKLPDPTDFLSVQ